MVEKYLGKRQARDLFCASAVANLVTEKRAQAGTWGIVKDIGGALGGGAGHLIDAVKGVPPALGWLMLTGAGLGTVGALAHNAIKERVSHDDPEVDFNTEIEALYNARRRELADAKWMSKVRSMRDELKRGYKKMTTEEYAKAYKALEDALDERSGR